MNKTREMKNVIKDYINKNNNFSIWEITQSLRNMNTETFNVYRNGNLFANCGYGSIDHALVKEEFLSLLSAENISLETSVEYANKKPYRVYSHNSHQMQNNQQINVDISDIVDYLLRRDPLDTTIKQIQSRFKRAKPKCAELAKIIENYDKLAISKNGSISKWIVTLQ